MKNVKMENDVQHYFCNQSLQHSTHAEQQEWLHEAPSSGITLSISVSSHHSFELCHWESMLYLSLFWESVSHMHLKVILAFCHLSFWKVLRMFYFWIMGKSVFLSSAFLLSTSYSFQCTDLSTFLLEWCHPSSPMWLTSHDSHCF